jgi:hypothetical protein
MAFKELFIIIIRDLLVQYISFEAGVGDRNLSI